MARSQIRRLPVVEDGQLLGIIVTGVQSWYSRVSLGARRAEIQGVINNGSSAR